MLMCVNGSKMLNKKASQIFNGSIAYVMKITKTETKH